MNLYDLEHRDTERNAFLGASNTRRSDPNRPDVGNFIEMPRRASCVSIWPLASHFVKTPAFAVAVVAELLHEISGIKVCAARAMLMNVAVIGELRSPFVIHFRQCSGVGKLQHHPKQRGCRQA